MMYDVLDAYREYLKPTFRPETIKIYVNRLEMLFEGQSVINLMTNFDILKIMGQLEKIEYKNEFSQAKNAFFSFLTFQNLTLSKEELNRIQSMEEHTHKKYRKMKSLEYQQVDKKIKRIKNKKLKISYQTLMETGMRVFELSQITKNDCIVKEDSILFYFTGKGGETETATVLKNRNKILYDGLVTLIKNTKAKETVFYSKHYLQTKAYELGFGCHDLRRISAKMEYKKTGAKKEVAKKLRHTNEKTTDIYLKSKIKMGKEETD